jgi:hypothetical protein
MIYFPFPDFVRTCAYFDLNDQKKQLKQVGQTLMDLQGIISFSRRIPKEPPKHVQAWRDYERALARYGEVLWASIEPRVKYRGEPRFYIEHIRKAADFFAVDEDRLPPWWGDPAIHDSHLQSILNKDKKCIRWPDLPAYPQVRNDDECEKAKAEILAVDASTLSRNELRALALKQNAVHRYIWRG